jgi:intracellular multiplication protein IcmG
MDNDELNRKPNLDEEYHFTESNSDEMTGFSAVKQPEPAASIFERIHRRHLLWLFGTLFAFAFLYWFIAAITRPAQSLKQPKIQKPPKSITSTRSTLKQPAVASSIATTASHVPAFGSNTAAHPAEIQPTGYQQTITRLDSQVSDLQATVASLEMRLSELDNRLSMRAEQIHELTRPVVHEQNITPKVKYYVHAIIPGRAWLKTNGGGATITVSTGETLKGFGVVEVIDVTKGTVHFSGGETIGFSPRES